jgi:hypothetical protein
MLLKFSVSRISYKKETVMKHVSQFQSPTAILRAEIEAWRTAGRMSREAVAIAIVEAHQASGADLATELSFDYEGSDTFARARKSAQKIFRWLDEGSLPANMILSILAALPPDVSLRALNKMLCPMSITACAADCDSPADLDVPRHLRAVMKEAGEAQMALVNLSPNASDTDLLDAHKELTEAAQACENAARDTMAEVVARQALARASESASK